MNMKQNRWAHINHKQVPLQPDHTLVNFLALPMALLGQGLSSTALLVYALLLDRGKLSQKKGWYDEEGVYVIYPNQELALELAKSVSAVRSATRQLESRGLILRKGVREGGANHIYLRLPAFTALSEHCQSPGSFWTDRGSFSDTKSRE